MSPTTYLVQQPILYSDVGQNSVQECVGFESSTQVFEDLREHVEQAYALLDDDSI
jgi:hypothetical protein